MKIQLAIICREAVCIFYQRARFEETGLGSAFSAASSLSRLNEGECVCERERGVGSEVVKPSGDVWRSGHLARGLKKKKTPVAFICLLHWLAIRTL